MEYENARGEKRRDGWGGGSGTSTSKTSVHAIEWNYSGLHLRLDLVFHKILLDLCQ